jgi:HEAT repeat protein
MPLFGPPNVEKLKTQRDVMGLVKALSYSKNQEVQRQAAAAESLGKIGDGRAVEPLVAALKHPRGEVLLSVEYHFASLTNKFFTRLLERSQ